MKAVRVGAPGEVAVVDLPAPRVSGGEALVRVERAAMCATDIKLVARGSDPPRVPGHEIVGRLDDGALVGVHPDIGCARCEQCRLGLENRCRDRASIGLDRDGGFAEWVAVPESHLIHLDRLDAGVAPLLEPLACCLHALDLLGADDGDLALVVGAGPMGVLAMWALQARGATVAVSQRSEARRAQVAALGADRVLSSEEEPATALGRAPGIAIVTAPGADALATTLERVAVGGRVHAFAGTPGGAAIDANIVHYRHLTLVGSTGSTVSDYRRAAELVVSGAIPLDRLPRTYVSLNDLPHALLDGGRTDALKVLVDVQGGQT